MTEAKLRPPPLREGAATRGRLLERLRGARSPAIVLRAPAGYGKTTALAQWAELDPRPLVWLAVDDADNDEHRFVRHLTAALGRVGEGPHLVVLDNVGALHGPASVAVLADLLAHVPSGCQIAVATRSELPFAPPGTVTVLDVDAFRLGPDESELLLRNAGAVPGPEQLSALVRRTEGWPLGLYLAALAPADALAGSDRFVSDYFRDELLARLPADDVAFLMRTSVLGRLRGQLCDAVLGTRGSAARLARLERGGAFLVRLDDGGYRYHRLFREMLCAELELREPGSAAALHARAAAWHEARGELVAAVEHAAAAGDPDRLLALVAAAAPGLMRTGDAVRAAAWIARLDDERVLRGRPALASLGAWAHLLHGRADVALRWAEAAPGGTAAAVAAALCRDGFEQMRIDAELAVGRLDASDPWRSLALLLRGIAELLAGDDESADVSFAAAAEPGSACAPLAAAVRRDAGHDPRAARPLARAGDPTAALVLAAGARAAVDAGNWVGGRNHADRAAGLLSTVPDELPWLAVQARLELARAYLGLGDTGAAEPIVADALAAVRAGPELGVLAARAVELATRVDEARGVEDGWTSSLTAAELRLLPLLATHLTFSDIAAHFGLSRNTVKTQAISVYRKFGVSTRSEAVARASTSGLVFIPTG